jgi:hypothetical protein
MSPPILNEPDLRASSFALIAHLARMGGVEIHAARRNAESEHAHVTVFLFTGGQITGIVQQSE